MADISKGVRSFTVGTGISRVLGLVREVVFARLFGVSLATDAFNAAFRTANLLRDLFAENALSSAFVPVLMDQKKKGKEAENRFASNIFNTLLLMVGFVTLLGMLFSSGVAKIIAPSFAEIPGKLALTGTLTAILFPVLLFIALAAWAMSVLNSENEFFIPSLAPAIFNIFSILVPLALFFYLKNRGMEPIYGAALGVTIGGFMQFAVQWPRLRRTGFRYRPILNFRDREFRRAMGLFVPVALGLSGSRINFFINTILVTSLAQGSLSWLNYAYRIMHLPLGLFGIAVGTVSLPVFTRLASENRKEEIRRSLSDSLKMVLFLTIPTSVLVGVLAGPITSVIYERGPFTSADTAATAMVLVLYMLGVPFISVLRNVTSVFYAFKDARRPLIASFIGVAVNIGLNLGLKGPLGLRAFPLSATIAAIVNVVLLYLWLPKKIDRIESGPLLKYFGLVLVAAMAGGGASYGASTTMARLLGSGLLSKIALLGICGVLGLGVFYIVCLLLRVNEARDFVKRFLKK